MRVKSKKTGDVHQETAKGWADMEKRDPGSQRRYTVLDREDIQPKNEHIPIQKLSHTIKQEIKLPLNDIAIYSSGFNTETYSIAEWTKFFEDNNIKTYKEIFENDPRVGIKNLING